MYLRHTTIRKDGKVHRYWRLVRSVRVGRRVIQQTVAQLGELDERGRVQARALAHRLIGTPEQAQLFDDGSEQLTVPMRLKGIRVERPRQFGDVYLAVALWRGTGLEALGERLLPIGKERIAWAKMAAVLVAARFCEPLSELHIAEDWRKARRVGTALQALSIAQPIDFTREKATAARSPLQDVLTAQPAVLIALIAHIVGTPLQDDIVRATDRLLRLGQDILATSAARAATPGPDGGAGRDRLRDVLQDPRLP